MRDCPTHSIRVAAHISCLEQRADVIMNEPSGRSLSSQTDTALDPATLIVSIIQTWAPIVAGLTAIDDIRVRMCRCIHLYNTRVSGLSKTTNQPGADLTQIKAATHVAETWRRLNCAKSRNWPTRSALNCAPDLPSKVVSLYKNIFSVGFAWYETCIKNASLIDQKNRIVLR